MAHFLRGTAVAHQGPQGFESSRQQASAGKPNTRRPYSPTHRTFLPFVTRTRNTVVAASASSRPGAEAHQSEGGRKSTDGGKGSNIFALLQVPFSTSPEDLRRAYRRRAKELHPDVNKAPDATESFHHLQKVYKEYKTSQENFGQGNSSHSREFMNMCHESMKESFYEDYDSEFW